MMASVKEGSFLSTLPVTFLMIWMTFDPDSGSTGPVIMRIQEYYMKIEVFPLLALSLNELHFHVLP